MVYMAVSLCTCDLYTKNKKHQGKNENFFQKKSLYSETHVESRVSQALS